MFCNLEFYRLKMHKFIFLFILLISTSCIDQNALDVDKYEELVITPDILLPFVQIDLSSDYYSEIYDKPSITETEVFMTVDLFEKIDISEIVTQIDFSFTATNGYPVNFDLMTIYFLDEFGNEIEKIVIENINAGLLNDDGSLKSATITNYNDWSFNSTSISALMYARSVRLVLSWNGNSIPNASPHPSFFFETYSDLILRTNIETSK